MLWGTTIYVFKREAEILSEKTMARHEATIAAWE